MPYNPEHILSNSKAFQPAAQHYKEYGTYTLAVPSSHPNSAYIKFWREEMNRCLNGFKTDNDWIPGYYYFYLNYCPIMQVESLDPNSPKAERVKDFPKVWDGDYQFFHYVEDAERSGSHAVTLKTRGRGYSFKAASMLNRNFFLLPNSKSFAVAYEKEYLLGDGVLTKAWDNLAFINENTPWAKKRHYKDTDLHKRASYKAYEKGVAIEKGYKSEIMGITVKDNPDRIRGKRGKLMIIEEAGKLPNLLQAWQVARPSFEQDGKTFGLMVCFGTGGSDSQYFEGLEELFYSPKGYNVHAVTNIWTQNAQEAGKRSALFMPQYMNMEGFMDENGNSLIEAGKTSEEAVREIVKSSTRHKDSYLRYLAERPFTPEEACLRLRGNIFPTKEIQQTLALLDARGDYENTLFLGDLQLNPETKKVEWKLNPKLKPLLSYPTKTGDSEGCVVIYEHPYTDASDQIPHGMYIGGIDPYDHDQSSTTSLGSILIYNRVTKRIVAEYTGRPETAKEFYETCRRLLLYYNATALYENEKKGIFDYFESKNSLYLLADEPLLIKDIIQKSTVSRKKGIHMNQPIKEYGEQLIKQWLVEPYVTENTEDQSDTVWNLHKIRCKPLLEELKSYDGETNADRTMALMMVMYYIQEKRRDLDKVKMGGDAKGVFASKLFQTQFRKKITKKPFW